MIQNLGFHSIEVVLSFSVRVKLFFGRPGINPLIFNTIIMTAST